MKEIKKVCFEDADFPAELRKIKNPPKSLYYIGDLSVLEKPCVAIVGSRKMSAYGRWVAESFGAVFGKSGVTVVSGMATGIDTFAHKGALKAHGTTVAVLGNGVDICFPVGNGLLKNQIEREGLVVSEYEPGSYARKHTFPERNRIISGLSRAVVVVEAGVNSGALITAELAVDQGREVYAVPGNINSVYSAGTNLLLKDGANPLTVAEDLLADLGIQSETRRDKRAGLSKDERRVFDAILRGGEMGVDAICDATKMSAREVNIIITVLEMKGIVVTALGRVFVSTDSTH